MTYRPTDLQMIDMQRATRLLLAWTTEDLIALDAVLDEVEHDDDPSRASHSLLAAVAHTGTRWGEQIAASMGTTLPEILRDVLLQIAVEEES